VNEIMVLIDRIAAALEVWRTWALEPAEEDAIANAEGAVRDLRAMVATGVAK
jgi:hypothetical protein